MSKYFDIKKSPKKESQNPKNSPKKNFDISEMSKFFDILYQRLYSKCQNFLTLKTVPKTVPNRPKKHVKFF